MVVSVSKLKKQLMDKIDSDDLAQVEKVERYVKLIELNRELDKSIKEDGAVVVTKNGAQEFVKTHPAVNDKAKINAQLLNIEKSFVFKEVTEEDAGPSASDLI